MASFEQVRDYVHCRCECEQIDAGLAVTPQAWYRSRGGLLFQVYYADNFRATATEIRLVGTNRWWPPTGEGHD